jgi:heme-degrading monooxygenase HmoA
MIIRTWRGAVRAEDADRYLDYLRRTGLASYANTLGNHGFGVWRRTILNGAAIELLVWSRWSSMDAVRAFAGDAVDRAVFYPEDEHFLIDRDDFVSHYELAEEESARE